jgi:hypothetical protein
MLAFSASVFADERQAAETNDKAVKIMDTTGKIVEKGTKCIAGQKMPDGSLTIYRANEKDVQKLIAAMNYPAASSGVSEQP